VAERWVSKDDLEGQWQEFTAGAVSLLSAAEFGVPVGPVGDQVQVGALIVPDRGVLDGLFELRAAVSPEDFESDLSVSSVWMAMEYQGQMVLRLDVTVTAPRRALARLLMNAAAVRPVLALAASGHPVYLLRESALRGASSPAAVLDQAIPAFQGQSEVLDRVLNSAT
jgi:hypothetical protein